MRLDPIYKGVFTAICATNEQKKKLTNAERKLLYKSCIALQTNKNIEEICKKKHQINQVIRRLEGQLNPKKIGRVAHLIRSIFKSIANLLHLRVSSQRLNKKLEETFTKSFSNNSLSASYNEMLTTLMRLKHPSCHTALKTINSFYMLALHKSSIEQKTSLDHILIFTIKQNTGLSVLSKNDQVFETLKMAPNLLLNKYEFAKKTNKLHDFFQDAFNHKDKSFNARFQRIEAYASAQTEQATENLKNTAHESLVLSEKVASPVSQQSIRQQLSNSPYAVASSLEQPSSSSIKLKPPASSTPIENQKLPEKKNQLSDHQSLVPSEKVALPVAQQPIEQQPSTSLKGVASPLEQQPLSSPKMEQTASGVEIQNEYIPPNTNLADIDQVIVEMENLLLSQRIEVQAKKIETKKTAPPQPTSLHQNQESAVPKQEVRISSPNESQREASSSSLTNSSSEEEEENITNASFFTHLSAILATRIDANKTKEKNLKNLLSNFRVKCAQKCIAKVENMQINDLTSDRFIKKFNKYCTETNFRKELNDQNLIGQIFSDGEMTQTDIDETIKKFIEDKVLCDFKSKPARLLSFLRKWIIRNERNKK